MEYSTKNGGNAKAELAMQSQQNFSRRGGCMEFQPGLKFRHAIVPKTRYICDCNKISARAEILKVISPSLFFFLLLLLLLLLLFVCLFVCFFSLSYFSLFLSFLSFCDWFAEI